MVSSPTTSRHYKIADSNVFSWNAARWLSVELLQHQQLQARVAVWVPSHPVRRDPGIGNDNGDDSDPSQRRFQAHESFDAQPDIGLHLPYLHFNRRVQLMLCGLLKC